MRQRISRIGVILSTVVVVFVGFSTLFGLLLGDITGSTDFLKNLPGIGSSFADMPDTFTLTTSGFATYFVRISVITVSATILIGILNLLAYNAMRFYRGRTISGRLNSAVTVVTFIAALILYIVDRESSMILLEDVQLPIEAALASLLFFALVYGAFRMLRQRVTAANILFIVTVLIVLLAALPLSMLKPVADFSDWLMSVPVNAGASGILLGIALATIVTGLRILIGQDRTYGE